MKEFRVIKLSDAVVALQKIQSFRASNLTAYVDDNNTYLIFSHATIIAKATPYAFGYKLNYFDNSYYSVTTSKYQKIIKKAFNADYVQERIVYKGEF